tara:strand:- start:1117 stop:1416 length:300 start_codon:yes stop_codon:yes gene_type:complete
MQDGDIFEVREEHLEQAIKNKKAESWRVCEECLVSVAAADHYNLRMLTSIGFIAYTSDDEKERWHSLETAKLVNLFDTNQYEQIREMLPITLTVGKEYA